MEILNRNNRNNSNNLKYLNPNYITKYSGKKLLAFYQIKGSNNYWYDNQILINSQKEFNELINACQDNSMNLVDIQCCSLKKDLEKTAQNAWNNVNKFIYKYGTISGLAELFWQYNLTSYEFEKILINLFSKGIIDMYVINRVKKEVNLI